MFENAVASIRMGVEDFRQQDNDRDISAVRNFYAGVLLLAKEVLIRKVPGASPDVIIGANHKPVSDGNGGLKFVKSGKKSLDFEQIHTRFKDFGLRIDRKSLEELNNIRNDMEHNFSSQNTTNIREAISKVFPVVAGLLRQINENPYILLGETWNLMLNTKELYDDELRQSRESIAKISWYSSVLHDCNFKCTACKSELLEQIDGKNTEQGQIEFRCRSCGTTPSVGEIIEAAVDDMYGAEAHNRAKDGGGDGPIYRCPACERTCIIEDEYKCVNCDQALDYQEICIRCSETISIQDFLDGLDDGLCSYCSYVLEKERDRD
ncbi:MAG: hypothetical protein ACOYOH_17675 [Paracraurococcus sp.]